MTTHSRYVDEFVNLKCSSDLLSHKLPPNGKEIAESMAASIWSPHNPVKV